MVARERWPARDDKQRFAYRIKGINVPGNRASAEKWTIAPVADDRTMVQWVLAVDCAKPRGLLVKAAPWPATRLETR